jgi:ubiquinone/menaquinone biosynthesis C-methylase UbiE
MNNSNKFAGELLERATDSEYLAKRMEMNKGFQRYDFGQWAIEQIMPKEGNRALEVGCGRGTQAIPLSEVIGKSGEITLIDLSKESVSHVLSCVSEKTKALGIHGSMDNIAALLGAESKGYDLAYSVYALYYANNPADVLNEMFQRLSGGGRLCIIGPDGPHGLVEIARKFHVIPPQVDSSFEFRSKVVEPFFKNNFSKFDISFLKNPQSITDTNQFVEFYRQTTYYVKESENDLRTFVESQIKEYGELKFDKYSYAVMAEKY